MSTARGERRLRLAASRELLYKLPLGELFELPGRPHVVYQIRSYASTDDAAEAVQQARNDIPFLFKAFETGQIGPKRMAKMHGGKPRMATIHEYLDWTITAQSAQEDDELVRQNTWHPLVPCVLFACAALTPAGLQGGHARASLRACTGMPGMCSNVSKERMPLTRSA